jgi:hypothetical protein
MLLKIWLLIAIMVPILLVAAGALLHATKRAPSER